MPAAIAIPAIIGAASAGASVVGAKMSSNAAHDAARMQSQSADKAQAFNQQMWQAQQQALAPYQQAGQQSLAALMQRQGGPSLEQRANSYVSAAQNGGGSLGQAPRPVGAGQSLGAMQQGAPMGAAMPYQGPAGGPQTVMMVGPDGTQRAVPIAQVQEATRRGAKMVQ